MKRIALLLIIISAPGTVFAQSVRSGSQSHSAGNTAYLGFDRNNYPGDQKLKALRQTFSYTGFWLNHPPSAKTNTWSRKRRTLQAAGFGFLVLFNGRLFDELKSVSYAKQLGKSDAQAAVAAARREGFPAGTIIFLDQEQGGPDAAGTESLYLRMGGWGKRRRLPRRRLLFRHFGRKRRW